MLHTLMLHNLDCFQQAEPQRCAAPHHHTVELWLSATPPNLITWACLVLQVDVRKMTRRQRAKLVERALGTQDAVRVTCCARVQQR